MCVNGGWFHDLTAAAKYGRDGAKKKQRQEDRKAKRELLENDYRHQIKETQKAFNELVRLLDSGKPCICCGRPTDGKPVDCGHFLSRGSHPELRFCFHNAYGQLTSCNRGGEKYKGRQHTTRQGFEQGITDRYGSEVLEWLTGPHALVKWTIDELKQMRAMYRAEIRYIEKFGKPSRDWRQFPPLEQAA